MPTHSWMRMLYKYLHAEFPYAQLVEENRRRGAGDPEFELIDTGVFDDNRYFDVEITYAKAAPDDILMEVVVVSRGSDEAVLQIIPQLWARNNWSWEAGRAPTDERYCSRCRRTAARGPRRKSAASAASADALPEFRTGRRAAGRAFRRIGEPEYIARAAVWLASDAERLRQRRHPVRRRRYDPLPPIRIGGLR